MNAINGTTVNARLNCQQALGFSFCYSVPSSSTFWRSCLTMLPGIVVSTILALLTPGKNALTRVAAKSSAPVGQLAWLDTKRAAAQVARSFNHAASSHETSEAPPRRGVPASWDRHARHDRAARLSPCVPAAPSGRRGLSQDKARMLRLFAKEPHCRSRRSVASWRSSTPRSLPSVRVVGDISPDRMRRSVLSAMLARRQISALLSFDRLIRSMTPAR